MVKRIITGAGGNRVAALRCIWMTVPASSLRGHVAFPLSAPDHPRTTMAQRRDGACISRAGVCQMDTMILMNIIRLAGVFIAAADAVPFAALAASGCGGATTTGGGTTNGRSTRRLPRC